MLVQKKESEERRTGKGKADVIIEHGHFAYCPGVLELERRLLLYTQDDTVLASDTHSTSALAHGF